MLSVDNNIPKNALNMELGDRTKEHSWLEGLFCLI